MNGWILSHNLKYLKIHHSIGNPLIFTKIKYIQYLLNYLNSRFHGKFSKIVEKNVQIANFLTKKKT